MVQAQGGDRCEDEGFQFVEVFAVGEEREHGVRHLSVMVQLDAMEIACAFGGQGLLEDGRGEVSGVAASQAKVEASSWHDFDIGIERLEVIGLREEAILVDRIIERREPVLIEVGVLGVCLAGVRPQLIYIRGVGLEGGVKSFDGSRFVCHSGCSAQWYRIVVEGRYLYF